MTTRTTDDRMKMLVNELMRSRADLQAAKGQGAEALKLYEKELEERRKVEEQLTEVKVERDDLRKEVAELRVKAAAWQTEVKALVSAGFEPGELEGPEKLRELMQSWTSEARKLDEEADEIAEKTGDKYADVLSSEAATFRTCAGDLSRFLRSVKA